MLQLWILSAYKVLLKTLQILTRWFCFSKTSYDDNYELTFVILLLQINKSVLSEIVEAQTPRFVPVKFDDQMCYPFFKCISRARMSITIAQHMKNFTQKYLLSNKTASGWFASTLTWWILIMMVTNFFKTTKHDIKSCRSPSAQRL